MAAQEGSKVVASHREDEVKEHGPSARIDADGKPIGKRIAGWCRTGFSSSDEAVSRRIREAS